MKPETVDYLEKTRRCLQNATKIAEAEAHSAIDTAARFVECIAALLA